MKTPEEIKKDAATCLTRPRNSECNRFALYKECAGDCGYVIKELYDLVLHLESRLAQVERERDAAVADCSMFPCSTCSDKVNGDLCNNCNVRKDTTRTNYEWRGVCPENTKEENE